MRNAFRSLPATFLFLGLCLAFASIASADSYVLSFDGQKIDVNSVHSATTSLGMSDELLFNIDVGKYTAQFGQDLAQGTHIDEMDLNIYMDGKPEPYETIVLTDDFVQSIAFNSSGPIPTEDVGIVFASIKYEEHPLNPENSDSGGGGTPGGGGTTNTPEPSTLALLAASMGSLLLLAACKKH
jgi:type VI protein secretion system component Hcp